MHREPSSSFLPPTMVSSTTATQPTSAAVSDRILSTVVPANVTGDVLHELSALDLAFKLHYLRVVYYFKHSEAIENLGIVEMKESLFLMLDVFYHVAGRLRRLDSGRPHLKCNDSGVRIIEARCALTVEEWLETEEAGRGKELVYDKVLGPDLFFSPLVYLQFTRFKCGGLAIGMNWAHILGDAVFAHKTLDLWAQILATKKPVPKNTNLLKPDNKITSTAGGSTPRSLKKVEPVGDFWLTPTNVRMVTFSFKISENKLKHLQSKISTHIPAFEAICAFVWKSLAKIREGKEPNLVTIVRYDVSEENKHDLGNNQIISTVSTDSSVAKLELSELATMMRSGEKDDKAIEELIESENGKEDYIIYGANLTFVDLQEVKLYGLEVKGHKPAFVDYSIHGVGEEGAVLVLPSPDEGRVLTVVLPEDEIPKLKQEMGSEWGNA